MKEIEKQVREKLFLMQDLKYKQFHSRLIPTVNEDLIIGVRTPQLRKFAKEFAKENASKEFLKILPHKYYEENNLHAFLIESEKDFSVAIKLCEAFLPYIDNWATCDMFSPKCFKKHPDKLLEKIKLWLKSENLYTVRYAIVCLLSNFLDEKFSEDILELVCAVKSKEYYINMAIAWFFSVALVKQYEFTLPYITEKRLDMWVHNKSIQKAVESLRIEKSTKEYLKTLKIKQR